MGRLRSLLIPGVDKKLLVRDAVKVMPDLARRRFIAGGASLGALTLLTGCDVTDSFSADQLLAKISKFNDAVQAAIFNPNALAPEFPESAITKPFPFNAYYDLDDAPTIDGKEWKLEVRGLVDNKLLVRDAVKVMPDLARRRFIAGGASLGALTLLTGCDVSDSFSAEDMLKKVSKFNDAVQALIFNPNALAPEFPESAITKPFPFNAYYDLEDAPTIDGKDWKFEVRGLVDNKKSWTLEELYKLPQVKQVTRHICVEGWSAIGSWTGTPLRDFLKLVGADTRAKYCWFQCADSEGYNSPLDMATALHPQTQMTFKFADEILPRAYGYPMKIRVPTKLGFKNPKYVISMEVTNDYKGGYWEDQGYNSFSGS